MVMAEAITGDVFVELDNQLLVGDSMSGSTFLQSKA
jgi:hypothetical protein